MQTNDSGAYVSESTKRTLTQFGWELGDPIPLNLGGMLSDIRERTAVSTTPGLLVDVSLMTDEDIELVKNTLLLSKQAAEAAKNRRQLSDDPNIRQLQQTIEQVESAQIIDDRADPQPVVAEKPAEPTPAPEAQSPAAAPEIPTPPLVDAAAAIPAFCPRCNWDMRIKYETEVTEFDKESFVAITLGGDRFKKTYSLLKGKFAVTFRGLMAEENTSIHHQLLLDQKDGDFLSDTEWFLRMFEYRLACSIASIDVADQLPRPIPELEEVAGIELPNKLDDNTKTPVVRLREYVLNDVLKSELTRRLVGSQFRLFQRLTEALEAMALDPNFW
jgi:hypothetical protein